MTRRGNPTEIARRIRAIRIATAEAARLFEAIETVMPERGTFERLAEELSENARAMPFIAPDVVDPEDDFSAGLPGILSELEIFRASVPRAIVAIRKLSTAAREAENSFEAG